MLESLFNKVAGGFQACSRCFSVIIAKLLKQFFYRTSLLVASEFINSSVLVNPLLKVKNIISSY